MAKDILAAGAVNANAATALQYRAFVFRALPPTPDFSRSQAVALPGLHGDEQGAWNAVFTAMRAEAGIIGGEILPLA